MKKYTFCNIIFKIRHFYGQNKTFLLTNFLKNLENKNIENHFQWIFKDILYKNDTILYYFLKSDDSHKFKKNYTNICK